MQKKVHRG
ncbi:putative transposase, partial [Vibrio parahaemolyticus VPTS-2010_2]